MSLHFQPPTIHYFQSPHLMNKVIFINTFLFLNLAKSIKLKTLNRLPFGNTFHLTIQASNIIEYEWPLKSGEKYFIQV